MRPEPSFEEKIDYVYKTIKAQKRAKIFRVLLKLAILGGLIVFLNSIDKNTVIETSTKIIGNIVKPITQNIIDDMIKSNSVENNTEIQINNLNNIQ